MANFDGDNGNNTITGTSGADRIRGFGGADILSGAGGDDIIEGGPGNDQLFGGAGADILLGGTGSDLLEGGAGSDVYQVFGGGNDQFFDSGSGSDTYVIDVTPNSYVLTDDGGSSDQITLMGVNLGGSGGFADIRQRDLAFFRLEDDLIIVYVPMPTFTLQVADHFGVAGDAEPGSRIEILRGGINGDTVLQIRDVQDITSRNDIGRRLADMGTLGTSATAEQRRVDALVQAMAGFGSASGPLPAWNAAPDVLGTPQLAVSLM